MLGDALVDGGSQPAVQLLPGIRQGIDVGSVRAAYINRLPS